MRLVIADTGPINYLLLIGHIEILPALFEKIILPSAVKDELANPDTPVSVREWIADPPIWVDIRHTTSLLTDASVAALHQQLPEPEQKLNLVEFAAGAAFPYACLTTNRASAMLRIQGLTTYQIFT